MDVDRQQSVIPKACMNCRIRKIRCNRKFPCSSCEASGIECQALPPGRGHARPAPRRPQSQTAQKLEDGSSLSESLAQIQDSLQQLLAIHDKTGDASSRHGSSLDKSPRVGVFNKPPHRLGVENREPDDKPPAVYEGASSFATQALHASEDSQSFARDPTQLAAAQDGLRQLRGMVQSNSSDTSQDSPGSRSNISARTVLDMQLPPTDYVIQLLKDFKSRPSVALLGYFFGGVGRLEKLCHAAYFPTEPISMGALTAMYGMLHFALVERVYLHPEENRPERDQDQDEEVSKLCADNFDRGIRSHDVLLIPSVYSAQALLIAATKAQDLCDINRAWVYTSAAARQLLSLGLHHEATYAPLDRDDAQTRRLLFWAVYSLDKALSLALGQTSTIRDHDLDVEPYETDLGPDLAPWDNVASFAKVARLQGSIFDRLYAVSTLKISPEERLQTVQELAQSLGQQHRWSTPSECYLPELHDLIFVRPSRIFYYSILTTIHRGSTMSDGTTGTITRECYDAACRSLHGHLDLFPILRDSSISTMDMAEAYLAWNLVYWAFTPLIVVFLHAISSLDTKDLDLLVRFKETLEQLQSPKEGALRLLKACQIFVTVAQAYIGLQPTEARTQTSQLNSVIRHEDVQLAFEAPQITTSDAEAVAGQEWAGLGEMQLDGMYNLLDNWIDGSYVPMDYFTGDHSGWIG